ncbi:GntR family transcriptional regulator [Actinoplanes sp. NPDC026619]|uniref:GntR family transcriptional regulator n=1 Tax=Actinoplanes sp. NPDC026619 TaxID=3155798 RepID=UPI0033DF474E
MPEIKVVLPKYLQIAAHYRDRILQGDLQPGDEVDSERRIADTWGVARPTATRALETLRREGLIDSQQGSGTRVRDVRTHRRASHRYNRFRTQGAQYAADESMELLTVGVVDAPEHVAEALGLEQPAQAMTRRRLISRQSSGPAEIATSWWPPSLAEHAPRLLEPVTLGGIGSVRYVESTTGRTASYARDQTSARLATAEEAALLQLGDGPAAILAYRHTVYDTADQILEFAESVYPPDAWSIEQEYPIEA